MDTTDAELIRIAVRMEQAAGAMCSGAITDEQLANCRRGMADYVLACHPQILAGFLSYGALTLRAMAGQDALEMGARGFVEASANRAFRDAGKS